MSFSLLATEEEESIRKKIWQSIQITPQQANEISQCEQKSEKWLEYRALRLTASNFGTAAGHNPYCSPEKLLKQRIWNIREPSNAAMEYGTKLEDPTRDLYIAFRKKQNPQKKNTFKVDNQNLVVLPHEPYLGYSPDGIVHDVENGKEVTFLLEIKVPFRKGFYGLIPLYYYDQIQGIMGIANYPYCDFVVSTPKYTRIQRFEYNEKYWKQILKPRLENWFMKRFLPRLAWKELKKIDYGEINPSIKISLNSSKSEPIVEDINKSTESRKRKECPFTLPTVSLSQNPLCSNNSTPNKKTCPFKLSTK